MVLPPSDLGRAPAVRLSDLTLALVACKMRRRNGGHTCQLAAMTAAPLLETDCHWRPPTARELSTALKVQPQGGCRVSPLRRGHLASLVNRVQGQRGRSEVLRTWGVGVAVLRKEPAFVLNGGKK